MTDAYVIHFVKGFAPGHTPVCGAESSMGSLLPRLVTCAACQQLLPAPAPAAGTKTSLRRRLWLGNDTPGSGR